MISMPINILVLMPRALRSNFLFLFYIYHITVLSFFLGTIEFVQPLVLPLCISSLIFLPLQFYSLRWTYI